MTDTAILNDEIAVTRPDSDYCFSTDKELRYELVEVITEALENLPYNYRNVVILRCFDQISWQDIAAVLDCNQNHARMVFCCARWSLECTMSENGFDKSLLPEALELYGRQIKFPAARLDLEMIRKKILN